MYKSSSIFFWKSSPLNPGGNGFRILTVIVLFVDNDFVFKCNPTELEQYLRDKPVACVKHKLDNIHNVKTYVYYFNLLE